MKYNFIRDNQDKFSITRMCQQFNIKRNSYYAWLRRPVSNRKKEDIFLLREIKKIYKDSHKIYGYPRVYMKLKEQGKTYGRNRIYRIMKENGIKAKTYKKYRHKGSCINDNAAVPNILNRNFNPIEKNIAWAMDIKYLWSKAGWIYLCVCMDLFNRKIIGWCASKRAQADIVVKALNNAIKNEKPNKNVIVHSDRGSQFGSNKFKELIKQYNFRQSMSRKGNCWDNACVESFFGKMKTEHFKELSLKNEDDTRYQVFSYIEGFYNRCRIHSTLKYSVPQEYGMKQKNVA